MSLAEGLRRRSWDDFEQAVVQVVGAGDDGDRTLSAALPDLPRDRKVAAAAALGDLRGEAGTAALRAARREPGASRDLRCAALLALAKRAGAAATDDLAEGLASRDAAVKDYALFGLACVAETVDASMWERIVARLEQMLSRPSRIITSPSPVISAVAYLMTKPSSVAATPLASVACLTTTAARARRAGLTPTGRRPSPTDNRTFTSLLRTRVPCWPTCVETRSSPLRPPLRLSETGATALRSLGRWVDPARRGRCVTESLEDRSVPAFGRSRAGAGSDPGLPSEAGQQRRPPGVALARPARRAAGGALVRTQCWCHHDVKGLPIAHPALHTRPRAH